MVKKICFDVFISQKEFLFEWKNTIEIKTLKMYIYIYKLTFWDIKLYIIRYKFIHK